MNFDELLGDQPDVPDWPGLVRRQAHHQQRRRRIAVTLAAASLLVVGSVGAVYAMSGTSDRAPRTLAIVTETATPAGSPETSASPLPKPTATPLGTAPPETPTATPTRSVVDGGPTTGTVVTQTQTIVISDVTYAPHDPTDGDAITVSFHVAWSAARPYTSARCVDCQPHGELAYPECPPPMGSPPPEKPGESDVTATVEMLGAGTHKVVVSAATSCGYFQGSDEVDINVSTAPKPTPTASTSETPAPNVSRT